MSVTILLGGTPASSVVTRFSPLAEVTASIHAMAEPLHHAAWPAGMHNKPHHVLVTELAPLFGPFRARYLLPLDLQAVTLEEERAVIATLPVELFCAMTAQALLGTNAPDPQDPRVSASARSEFLARLRPISENRLALGEALLRDPQQVREAVLELLSITAQALVGERWDAQCAQLRLEAQRMQHQLGRRGVSALDGLPGARLLSEPMRLEFDKLYHATVRLQDRPCVLVPSVQVSPHLVVKHYTGLPVVVQYPASVAQAGDVVPLEMLRLRLAALQDATRLRMCRAMLRRPVPTVELARSMNMTPPQASRHLRRLREAGLVTATRRGSLVYYQLDTDAIAGLGAELLAYFRR
ncbi:DUF5937 family protein [Streptomyces sp. NPDC057486]|uniref:ArsR/SmtB family transcription factor n=1 Tax=Streptomyces sp. NPDC057486 TaxID=3346145 RepID=UPI003685389F